MLAARHRARLTMQDRNVDVQEGIRFRSVRRRLFQEEDEIEGGRRRDLNTGIEDNVVNCFFEEARKHREEAKQKWNFDFEKEIPLEGNYQWVKLDRDGNEIPMNAEVQNKTEKMEKNENDGENELGQLKEGELKENEIKEEKKDEEDEEDKEEEPPEGKEVDANDKTESRRQKNRNLSRTVDVL